MNLEIQDDHNFQVILGTLFTHPSRRSISFDNKAQEQLVSRINKFSQLVSSDTQQTSSFAQCLELVEDLSVATDFAFQQFQKSNVEPPSAPAPSILIGQKRGKEENIEITEEEDISKKQKKNPFTSAKDKFRQEGGKFEEGVEKSSSNSNKAKDDSLPPALAQYDKQLVERIEAEIIHHGDPVTFQHISGLSFAKKTVQELICWPMQAPGLFTGLRSLPRGILLFGPPGTGKTLIGKAIAHQSGATFFSISASSLMSKWIGEGEKTVRTLFAVANYRQPSVVFIDEIDSLLCQRSSDENEATRRIKTEFMVQLDGANTSSDSRVVILGATNRPEELDEAVRRRFVKRLYIPLPDSSSRKDLISTLLAEENHNLSLEDMDDLVVKTSGFSGADLRALCTEAAMGPLRNLLAQRNGDLLTVSKHELDPIEASDFLLAFDSVKPSVSPNDLQRYIEWNNTFGSYRIPDLTQDEEKM